MVRDDTSKSSTPIWSLKILSILSYSILIYIFRNISYNRTYFYSKGSILGTKLIEDRNRRSQDGQKGHGKRINIETKKTRGTA